jgi:hypothetical protein
MMDLQEVLARVAELSTAQVNASAVALREIHP